MATGIGPVPDGLNNEDLSFFLLQIRKQLLDITAGRIVALNGGATSASTGVPTPAPPGPPGPPGAGTPYVPDLTAPPTPSGVSVVAGLDFVFITTAAPTFTEGHGYDRTLVYFATYGGTGPLPTFSGAVLGHEYVGQVGSFAAPPGSQYHVWLKWRTKDGVLSVSPEGGANGHQVTTSLIGNSNLGPLIIEAAQLADGAVTSAKFAAGIEPVDIVAVLPNPVGYVGHKNVFLTTDGKLYRYVAGAWVTGVAAVDVGGQITSTQIADNSISTPKLQANSITAAKIAADTITANEIAAGAITANELAANSVIAGKIAAAAISATEIAAGAITATKIAANAIAVGTLAVQNGAIVNAMLGNATITDAKIASLSASKILAGSIAVGEYIQSSDFVSGLSGWRLGGNTAELGTASLRGLLTAAQIAAGTITGGNIAANTVTATNIDSRGLTIKDAAGNIIFSSGLGADATNNILRNPNGPSTDGWASSGAIASGSTGIWVSGIQTWLHFNERNTTSTILIPVIPGESYYFSADTLSDFGAAGPYSIQLFAQEFSGAQVNTHNTVVATRNVGVVGQTTISGTYTVPAGVFYIQYYVFIDNGVGAFNSTTGYYLRNMLLRRQITPSNASTFIANASIGNAQIGGAITSTGYVPGVTGWSIDKAGSAEFNTGTFRGALAAASGTFAGSLSAVNGTFSGTLTVGAINAVNTINITPGAVSAPAYAQSGSGATAPLAFTTILTLGSINPDVGGVAITVTVDWTGFGFTGGSGGDTGGSASSSVVPSYRVLRNGAVVVGAWTPSIYSITAAEFTPRGTSVITLLDSPGAAAVYTLQHSCATAGITSSGFRTMASVGLKR